MRVSLRGIYPRYTFFSGRDIGARQSDDGCKAQGRFGRGRSAARSCRRLHGLQSNRIGAPIHSALIASRGPLRLAAERPATGLGGLATVGGDGLARSGRRLRHIENANTHRGPGCRCVCGQPVYRLGWHVDLWETGPNKNAVWHCACVAAWQLWNAPSGQIRLLRLLQRRRCGQTGGRLWKNAEVDHRVPLFRVGANTETTRGRTCSIFGACRTFS
jgi:hypothetical protein